MTRNREDTENKLIKATGQVLANQGFGKLGVNSIARQARLDKVLIYRYFDGLPGLMRAYAKQGDFWPTTTELMGCSEEEFLKLDQKEQFKKVMREYSAALRRRPVTLQILSWEMIERNELTSFLEEVREQQGVFFTEQLQLLGQLNPNTDIPALLTIISGAINYLTARSQKIRWFNGVDLNDDQGWERLDHIVELILDSTLTI